MNKQILVALALIYILSVFVNAADVTISLKTSTTLTGKIKNKSGSLSARLVKSKIIALPTIGGMSYRSLNISGSATNSSGTASVDAISGIGWYLPLFPPGTVTAFFKSNLTADFAPGDVNLDYSGSAGISALLYLGFSERDSTGAEVAKIDFKSRLFSSGDKSESGDVQYLTFSSGGGLLTGTKVTFQLFMASQLGEIDVAGGTLLTPNSVETVVSVEDHDYKSSTNTLTLQMLAISASVSANASVSGASLTRLINGVGDSAAYFDFSGQAQVGTSGASVKVEVKAGTSYSLSDFLPAVLDKLKNKFGASASIKLVEVTFPAGAKTFSYDPSIGVGEPPVFDSSATAAVPTFTAVVLMVVLALFY